MHGTTASALEKIVKAYGNVAISHSSLDSTHDFGSGFYCFKDELRWALSFAIDRCWPIMKDPETGKAIIKRCNPAIILFPNHDHTIINGKKTLKIIGPPICNKDVNEMKKFWICKTAYNEFVECRKKWKHDKKLGYWNDFVKLSLIYDETPPRMWSSNYQVYYGLMHSNNLQDKPIGNKIPVVHKDGWIQYCFLDPKNNFVLGEERFFIEFDIDWNEWIDSAQDCAQCVAQCEVAKKELEIEIEKPLRKDGKEKEVRGGS